MAFSAQSVVDSIRSNLRIRERLISKITAQPDSRAYLDQVARIDEIFIDEIAKSVYIDSIVTDSEIASVSTFD